MRVGGSEVTRMFWRSMDDFYFDDILFGRTCSHICDIGISLYGCVKCYVGFALLNYDSPVKFFEK